jgi:hypothetical protein
VTSLRAGVTQLAVGVLGGLVVGNGALLELNDVLDGQDSGGVGDGLALGGLDVFDGSVTLLGLTVAAGEEDEAVPVLLEALDVGLEAPNATSALDRLHFGRWDVYVLLREVLAARVDGDTNGAGKLAGNASSLELNKAESATGANAPVVFHLCGMLARPHLSNQRRGCIR